MSNTLLDFIDGGAKSDSEIVAELYASLEESSDKYDIKKSLQIFAKQCNDNGHHSGKIFDGLIEREYELFAENTQNNMFIMREIQADIINE